MPHLYSGRYGFVLAKVFAILFSGFAAVVSPQALAAVRGTVANGLTLPAIQLATSHATALKKVTVTARKPLFEHRADRTVVNVADTTGGASTKNSRAAKPSTIAVKTSIFTATTLTPPAGALRWPGKSTGQITARQIRCVFSNRRCDNLSFFIKPNVFYLRGPQRLSFFCF